MGLNYSYIAGQTPLDDDEKEGLLIDTITTHSELDEFEQKNIEEAIQWMLSRSFKAADVFTEAFICNLHRRMYGHIWQWAGSFRHSNKNIGVDKWQIATALRCLMDDLHCWREGEVFPPDEIAIRFKHRLVSIHCFPNGNGRHSRLMADLIIHKLYKLPFFGWGGRRLTTASDIRTQYLCALRAADRGCIDELVRFARGDQ